MIIVDAEHWLADGDLPHDGPAELYRNALRLAHCIEYGGPMPRLHMRLTLIPCRRRPAGSPCRGNLYVVKTERDEIHAFCPRCHKDEFLISNWQGTLFADGPPEPLPVAQETPPDPGALPAAVRTDLERALLAMGSSWDVAGVSRLIATSQQPGAVIERIVSASRAPTMEAVQALAGALMAAWNHTPRPELDGQTPEQRHHVAAAPHRARPKVGRNEPCPCGSGTKYKKCCGAAN